MVHVYGLSDSARENVSTAAKIAADVSQPNAADVDSQGRFPDESRLAPRFSEVTNVDQRSSGAVLTASPLKPFKRLQNYSLTRYHLAEARC